MVHLLNVDYLSSGKMKTKSSPKQNYSIIILQKKQGFLLVLLRFSWAWQNFGRGGANPAWFCIIFLVRKWEVMFDVWLGKKPSAANA